MFNENILFKESSCKTIGGNPPKLALKIKIIKRIKSTESGSRFGPKQRIESWLTNKRGHKDWEENSVLIHLSDGSLLNIPHIADLNLWSIVESVVCSHQNSAEHPTKTHRTSRLDWLRIASDTNISRLFSPFCDKRWRMRRVAMFSRLYFCDGSKATLTITFYRAEGDMKGYKSIFHSISQWK